MIVVPMTVDDAAVRETFLRETMHRALAELKADTRPQWGRMNAQQMVEHLLWSVRGSTGAMVFPVKTPEQLLERAKRFLYHDRQTPQDFMNPLLTEGLPPLEYPDLPSAVAALSAEMQRFLEMRVKDPEAVRPHPIFGPLKPEEWERSHFKHCHHHLGQFGVIEAEKREE
jgi:oxepin-CoA hydrolase/3-oxo-5,6-dehydrosuberyl-CoA semialdehyde dehydrogenase